MAADRHLLSVVADPAGDTVYVHADKAGLKLLIKKIQWLLDEAEAGNCEHSHLFSAAWGSDELTETMLADERQSGNRTVHHLKIYGWTDDWSEKHGLRPSVQSGP